MSDLALHRPKKKTNKSTDANDSIIELLRRMINPFPHIDSF